MQNCIPAADKLVLSASEGLDSAFRRLRDHAWLSRKELAGNKVGHKRFITHQQIANFYQKRKSGLEIDYTYAPR